MLLLPLLLGVALLVAVIATGRWFAQADPARIAAMARSSGGLALMAVGALLLARGQGMLGASLVMAGLARFGLGSGGGFGGGPSGRAGPFGMGGSGTGGTGWGGRGGRGWGGGMGRRRANPRPGQTSTVRTAKIAAELDHDTGEMDGEVLSGPQAGRHFADMGEGELLAVWRWCADDEESRLLVEAYLDRRFPSWREDFQRNDNAGASGSGGAGRERRSGALTEQDAYEVLGLEPGAGEAEIRAAHRRLMKQMHPDRGGSAFLAAQLNEAKDILLRRR
nr:DnaJ domain-containing protein [Acuticoccus mangrovi]